MTFARPLLAVLLLAPAACVSGRDCVKSIPENMRADAIRFALDRGLCAPKLLSRADEALALGAGKSYASMTEARRTQLAPYAVGYAACLKDRVNRE